MSTVPFFQSSPAIQSLRESDFDANSAYGEVIDNSLQANAENIRIRFDVAGGGGRADIQAVAFGDDGTGMDANTLHNCLTIGWSSRYNDRDGIGRFGVGMTLGAIHECRRVEVWTKEPKTEWLFTYLDLDEIEEGDLQAVPAPKHKKLPKEFADLPGAAHGTLIVWRKHDRQLDTSDRLIEDFRVWCGRTYRYFIWDTIEPRKTPLAITIDGIPVHAIDPLYVRTEKTRFPEDPKAHLFEEMTIQWNVDWTSPGYEEGRKSNIRIRMSKLPEEFRKRTGEGGDQPARERFIDENEGISILRNFREVFYGPIPYWKAGGAGWPSFMDIDRWWGCEVLFAPDVDRAFQVKNIKRGAVPTYHLKVALKDKIKATRETVLEDVRALWSLTGQADKEAKEAAQGEKLLQRAGSHDLAEGVVKRTAVPVNQLDAGKDASEEAHKAAANYSSWS